MKYLFVSLIGCIIGIVSGLYVSSAEIDLLEELKRNTLGSSTQKEFTVYGFQPFWLLDSADTNYSSYLTHLGYFGLQIGDTGNVEFLNAPGEQEPGWTNLQTARVKNSLQQASSNGLTNSLAVQNANEESIALMLSDPETSAQNLLSDIIPVMEDYGFTDLNIDVESFTVASADTQQQFSVFVEEVSKGIKAKGWTVSIDVTPISAVAPRMINLELIEPHVDEVILMTYDYHYLGSSIAGPVAPLGGAPEIREFDVTLAVNETLKVIPASKLILGIPTYGYEWDTISDSPDAPTISNTGKTASVKRVKQLLADCNNCKQGRDEFSKQPYLIIPADDGDYYRQIYYEDAESLQEKIEFAKQKRLKGIAIWALGYEDEEILQTLKNIQ